jgi:HEPN domain-containing protein
MPRGAGSSSGPEVWFRRARRYLRIAKSNLSDGYADVASFYAQQAAEFALKALQIHRQGVQERTHDLTRLARVLSAPPRVLRLASNVTLAYVVARYPDVGGGRITRRRAEAYIDAARRIVNWVRREMV